MAKVKDVLYGVYIDIEDGDGNTFKTSCQVDTFVITSIQNRKKYSGDKERIKLVFISKEIVYSPKEKVLVAWEKIEFEKFNISAHKRYAKSKAIALKKAIKNIIPTEIQECEQSIKEGWDKDYYEALIKCYDKTIRSTLTRMLNNEEKKSK